MNIAEFFLKLRADVDRNASHPSLCSRAGSYFVAFGICSLLAMGVFAYTGNGGSSAGSEDLILHEWGTFTSIAGDDGPGVEWRPQTGSTDLPGFVEHLEGADFKGGLRGTV